MNGSTFSTGTVDADVQKAIRMAMAATDKRDYETALTLFRHVYDNPSLGAPADGLSHYGLCVAIGEKQTKKGIDLCQAAIERQFYDSTHHANLVKLHLARGNRRLAVQAMEGALRELPGDQRLTGLRNEMGYRARNPVPFLPRESAINRMLGPRRRGTGKRVRSTSPTSVTGATFSPGNLQPLQMLLFGFLGFATVFAITFYIMYQRAYG